MYKNNIEILPNFIKLSLTYYAKNTKVLGVLLFDTSNSESALPKEVSKT